MVVIKCPLLLSWIGCLRQMIANPSANIVWRRMAPHDQLGEVGWSNFSGLYVLLERGDGVEGER